MFKTLFLIFAIICFTFAQLRSDQTDIKIMNLGLIFLASSFLID